MTYAARETSRYQGSPFELYLFQSTTESWRYTSGDTARLYLGQTYQPEALRRTEIDQNQEIRSGEIRVSIPRTNDLATRFLSYIPASPISLVIYRGHDGDPDSEVVMNFTGRVVKADFSDDCTLTVVSETDLLRKRVPVQKFQPQCNWILYCPGCGVDRNLFKVTASVSGISGDMLTAAAFGTKPDGWFNNGYIERGEERRMILSHTGNTVTLITPMSSILVGDSITAYAGCNRDETDCAAKFNNLVNHWGFGRIPKKNPFDGGLT